MSVGHYENFPVASRLVPAALRPAVVAIYRFARSADDIADEGDAPPAVRLADLEAYGRDLDLVAEGSLPSPRWGKVFIPLASAMSTHVLPRPLLHDLLDAFRQDVIQHDYSDRAELLDYCRRSANPIGRLLLHLYGITDERALAQSDAICTALQLANFWQDLSIDTGRGRVYPPASDLVRHGVGSQALRVGGDSREVRALVADLVDWARQLMLRGADLVHAVPGRAGWELRLVVQGGLRILEKIQRIDHAVLLKRPALHWSDTPVIVWRATGMRPARTPFVRKAT